MEIIIQVLLRIFRFLVLVLELFSFIWGELSKLLSWKLCLLGVTNEHIIMSRAVGLFVHGHYLYGILSLGWLGEIMDPLAN